MEQKEFTDWLASFTDPELALSAMEKQKGSFRINTLKIPPATFEEVSRLPCSAVPWYPHARVLEGGVQLGNTFEYFLGYLHPQSLSSMVPPLVLAPKNTDRVLDLTAAPGSKTTQLSALMGNKGTIVANDEPEREIFIVNNLSRLGALNVMVTNRDAKVWPLKNEFDKVLLDAPCSALGSNLNAIRRFSIPGIDSIASVQKRMIVSAFDALKPGGILVYSTCTYAPQENEEVLAYLMAVREAARPEEIPLQIPHEHGLEGFEKAWRIYPQTLGSEGFFVAKISKAI